MKQRCLQSVAAAAVGLPWSEWAVITGWGTPGFLRLVIGLMFGS
jgi:hypothetical protein